MSGDYLAFRVKHLFNVLFMNKCDNNLSLIHRNDPPRPLFHGNAYDTFLMKLR